ncbi:Methyl-CpG-binding domain protein [Fagus crenata]
MERGDQPSSAEANRNNESHSSMSPLTRSTISKIMRNPRRAMNPRSRCTFHDNSSRGFGWLLPGWVAEERVMDSGRLYRYYYDPSGHLYRSRHEVINAWEDLGIVVLDK